MEIGKKDAKGSHGAKKKKREILLDQVRGRAQAGARENTRSARQEALPQETGECWRRGEGSRTSHNVTKDYKNSR